MSIFLEFKLCFGALLVFQLDRQERMLRNGLAGIRFVNAVEKNLTSGAKKLTAFILHIGLEILSKEMFNYLCLLKTQDNSI